MYIKKIFTLAAVESVTNTSHFLLRFIIDAIAIDWFFLYFA